MTTNSGLRGRTALAVGTALSLGALGVLTSATAASAASIDPARTGQIIIHKYADPGNGSQNPSGTGTDPDTAPIAGVVFEYCTIDGIDLLDGSGSGWDAVNAITAADRLASGAHGVDTLASHALTGCAELPATDAAGRAASAADLPFGAYFVREISAPANVVAPAAPFIVTLPSPQDPHDLTGGWVYAVNVYPKNTIATGPVKNVVGQPANGALLGAPVRYEVTQLVPALAPGEGYSTFSMVDTLDAKLTPSTGKGVTVEAGSARLEADVDYQAVWVGQRLTVTFTPAGLAKLRAGQHVVFGFEAAANAVGEIDNTAFVNLNDFVLTPGIPNGPGGSPTTTATTRWGDLTVRKVNAADAADGLAGAKFRLYRGDTDHDCAADITGLVRVTDPVSGDPYVVTSDSAGTVAVPGLWIGDTEKTVEADGTVSTTTVAGHDVDARCYVLEEIAAPAGFVLPNSTGKLTPVLVKTGANGAVPLVTIENRQLGAPELPFTGSSAQVALTIGGIALVVVALGGVLLVRRRNATRAGD